MWMKLVASQYKALGLVEEPRLDDIIYVVASDSDVTLTPDQAEQTQFIAPHMPPLTTRSATVIPSTTPTHSLPVPTLPSDALSPSDRFILDEVIRHNHSTQTSPLPPPELSQPIISDGYHYKQISLHKCPKSVRPF